MSDPITLATIEGHVLNVKLESILASVVEIKATMAKVSEAMVTLALVAQRQQEHETTIDELSKRVDGIDARVTKIDRDLPSLLEARKWVIGGIIGVISLIAAGIFEGVITIGRLVPH